MLCHGHTIKNGDAQKIMLTGLDWIHPTAPEEISSAVPNLQMVLPQGTVSFSRGQAQGGRMKKRLLRKRHQGVFIGLQKKDILRTGHRMNQGIQGASMMMGCPACEGVGGLFPNRHRNTPLAKSMGHHGPCQTRPHHNDLIIPNVYPKHRNYKTPRRCKAVCNVASSI